MSRRRGPDEPPFSSDSFVDVITNLVGIVLIIMVMVVTRVRTPAPGSIHEADLPESVTPTPIEPDPRVAALQSEVAELQRRLLATRKEVEGTEARKNQLAVDQSKAAVEYQRIEAALQHAKEQLKSKQEGLTAAEMDSTRLTERLAALRESIKLLEKEPPNTKALRYHLPVSQVVAGGEIFFECKKDKITFIDLQPMLDDLRSSAKQHRETLKTRWEVTDAVGATGSFRLEYTLVRDRDSASDPNIAGLAPNPNRGFSFHLSKWILIPIEENRGETLEASFKAGSELRRVIDGLNPEQVVLTFWVYPESFETFRGLRDYLYDRGFTVAGRPLPDGERIGGSPTGTASRGQ